MAKASERSGGGGADPVQAYIDDIAAEHRALFDRLHGLILRACPQATVLLSYGIPTYSRGGRRLYLGVWKHGVSIYGWQQDQDGGFVSRHPELKTSTGTIRLRPQDAAGISDQELDGLIRTALDAD
jgi:uncharacterized protein YdhG (YjbR/CyaY superfamily)